MAVMDNTALSPVIDERWRMEVDEGRYASAVVMPRVLNASENVKGHGDIVHLTYMGKVTIGVVTAGTGAFTPQQTSLSQVDLTVDQWEYAVNETPDKSKAQSFWDIDSVYPKAAGQGFGEQYDAQLLSLYSSFQDVGIGGDQANPSAFTDVQVRAALLYLADLNIPKDELSFFLAPIAFYDGICAQPQFTDADKAGLPKSVLTTGYRFPLMGVPTYETTKISEVGNARKCLLAHKSAMACAFQKNVEIQKGSAFVAGKFSYLTGIQSLYGFKAFRTDHAVQINVKKS